jgi:DNA-binding GntR family transcriptional regulator
MAKNPTIPRVSMPDQVHEIIRGQIFDRVYEPGERLQIEGLARALSVSATPVREALGRLAAEGLVTSEPFVGFSVAPLPPDGFYEQLYDFRLVLELWAARMAARRRIPAGLEAMRSALARMEQSALARSYSQFRRFAEADEAFHRAIFVCAGNEPALKAFTHLRTHLLLSRLYIQREQSTEETRRFHDAIADAIRAGDEQAAEQQMRLHLEHSRRSLLGGVPDQQKTPSTHSDRQEATR